MNSIVKNSLLILLLISKLILSQQSAADSLKNELDKSQGQRKVDLLNELSDIYQYINTGTAINYAEASVNLAASINYKKDWQMVMAVWATVMLILIIRKH